VIANHPDVMLGWFFYLYHGSANDFWPNSGAKDARVLHINKFLTNGR